MHLISLRQQTQHLRHLPFHRLAQLQLVGRGIGSDGHIDGVQAIDAVIALWRRLHMSHLHQLVKPYEFAPAVLHHDVSRIERLLILLRHHCQTDPFLTTRGIHIVRS